MDFDEFYNLTPGERTMRRGTSAPRPFQPDWQNEQLVTIVDSVRMNPWFVHTFGRDIDVSVNVSKDGFTLALFFTKTVP